MTVPGTTYSKISHILELPYLIYHQSIINYYLKMKANYNLKMKKMDSIRYFNEQTFKPELN